jgi:hypothetical protein
MPMSFDDVSKLVKLMVDNKISLIEFDGVKIVKGLHDLPQERKDPKKTPSDDDILFDPYKGM